MNYRPVTSIGEIRKAFQSMRSALVGGMKSYQRTIGFPSGNVEARVHWRPAEHLWLHMSNTVPKDRFWFCFGTSDPAIEKSLSIVAEINPPTRGYNRQVAGAFIRAIDGSIYLAHSGRIGGGKPKVGKQNFLEFLLGAQLATVEWPDGARTNMILIGEITDKHLPQQIANFVYEVQRFKNTINIPIRKRATIRKKRFIREFGANRKQYKLGSSIQSVCDHGVLVNELYNILSAMDVQAYNDQQRDLYIEEKSGNINLIFELKTSNTTSDIYSGIGQLLYHSASEIKRPSLCLVLPEGTPASAKQTIKKLKIDVLEYNWSAAKPLFPLVRKYVKAIKTRLQHQQ